MDGAGHFLIFWRIALPLARAPMIAATVILFTLNWNNFLWPLLVTFDETMKTLPVGIAAFAPVIGSHTQLEGFALGMAGVTVLSVPSLLLFFVLQRYFIQGIASGAITRLSVPHLEETSCVTGCSSMAVGSTPPAGRISTTIDPATEEPTGRDRPRRSGGCRPRRQGGRCRHEGALVAPGAGGARARCCSSSPIPSRPIARSWPGSRPWMSASRSRIRSAMSMAW